MTAPRPSITTALTSLLAIRHPVLLAPMGDTAGGRLAAAVSEAGGLGLIGGGYADPRWLERELDIADGARVGVGFVTFALNERPDTLRLALEAPAGVSIGTRFLATTEAISSAAEAAAIVAGRGIDTVRSSAFDVIRGPVWPDGLDGRTLRNEITDTWNGTAADPVARRRYADDPSLAPVWAGEALDLITEVVPVADVVASIVAQAGARLRSLAGQVGAVVPDPVAPDEGGDPACWAGLVEDQRDRPTP